MKIYTIIVTYNAMRNDWIERSLRSLETSTVPVIPIVIDNASTDNTVAYIQEHHPNTILLPQERNTGFGQGNNIGIRYALAHDAEYVLLLNQDASLHPEALELMLKESDGESLISPIHCNGDGSDFDHNFKQYTLPTNINLPVQLKDCQQMKGSFEIGEVCAACWFMPISLIHKIGGFNPLFFHYGEDRNYYQRILYHNIKTLIIPAAKMFHDRNIQGNQSIFNKNLLHNNMLLVVSNINLRLGTKIKGLLVILLNSYKNDLYKKKYKIGAFGYEILWMIMHIRTILYSNKQEKKLRENWL